MSITNGTALGPYEIVEPLGAGGMGEVYRARDTRLERSVAIKVLPQGIASGTMRARFDREAKAISGLTHANICALYDVGHQDGIDYLVMEYLEGETLADKIARGPLPLSQVLRYGAEIAQALHHAHRRGITHRDLKPGNVMITAGGVKLLDFGLAKLAETPHEISGESQTMTRKDPLTAEGTIVGTLPYMSPEHVEGKIVDHRSDIFSLGVMLYEMATGRRPFTGGSQPALIASILSSDPPPQASIPPALDRVIRTALEKDPDERWQTAQDLARQLRWLSESSSIEQPAIAPRARRRVMLAAAVALAMIGAVVTMWAMMRRRASFPPAAIRLSVALPPGLDLARSPESNSFAISPDGQTIAVLAVDGGKRAIYLRRLDSQEVKKLDGSDFAWAPFWSPDGLWIGYSARGKLWKTRATGGTTQALCDVAGGAVGSWQGDTIVLTDLPGGRPVVRRVSAAGGESVPVTKLNTAEGEVRHTFPHLLPDGKHFLYVAAIEGTAERRLMLASLDSSRATPIAVNVSGARFADGRLLYVREGRLYAQPFDVESGLSGDPKLLAEDVSFFIMTGRATFDASANGVLAYATNTRSGRLAVVDRKGKDVNVLEREGSFYHLDVSFDGKKAAVSVRSRGTDLQDIWTYDLTRGVGDRFTSDPGVETGPAWAPDGRSIVYGVATGGPPQLIRRAIADRSLTPIRASGAFQTAGSFSRDGKSLYYTRRDGYSVRIARIALDGSNRSEVVVDDPSFWEQDAQISPDGRWLAFASEASGVLEVYVQNLASGERVRLSKSGGYFGRWRKDGGELFYVAPDNTVVGVVPREGAWDQAVATELFRVRNNIEGFDVVPDGQSFVLAEWKPSPADGLIHVATGW